MEEGWREGRYPKMEAKLERNKEKREFSSEPLEPRKRPVRSLDAMYLLNMPDLVWRLHQ